MPRPKNTVPTYRRHKASNRAFVVLDGKTRTFLGRYGSPESKAEYAKIVAGLKVDAVRSAPRSQPSLSSVGGTVADVALAFVGRNLPSYSDSEQAHFRFAVKILRHVSGGDSAADFGPLALSGVRDAMVGQGWSRKTVNDQVGRVRRIFRWAESVELVPAGKWFQLRSLPGLKPGQSAAKEQRKKTPAGDDVVSATLPHMPPTVAAMVMFQRLTGCRPQDVRRLNHAEIDRTGTVWVFRPAKHKGAWRGLSREVYIGPKAQEIIRPYLDGREDAPAVFSPRQAWQEWRDIVSAGNKNRRRESYVRKGAPVKVPLVFTKRAHCRHFEQACRRAGVVPFTPHQLRHSFGTEVREKYGLEVAQKLLGHASAAVTEIYAKPSDRQAIDVIGKIG